MKILLTLLLLFVSTNSSAHCIEQRDYNFDYQIQNKKLYMNIEKKDKSNFNYYEINSMGYPAFLGFKFKDDRKLNIYGTTMIGDIMFNIFPINSDKSTPSSSSNNKEIKNIKNFPITQESADAERSRVLSDISNFKDYELSKNSMSLEREKLKILETILKGNNDLLSSSIITYVSAERHTFPLNKFKTTNAYKAEIDLDGFIKNYKEITEYNNIYGKQGIKFYVNLIQSPFADKCVHFETNDIEYDFGLKVTGK